MGCEDYHALKRDIINEHTHTKYIFYFILFIYLCDAWRLRNGCFIIGTHHRCNKNAFFLLLVLLYWWIENFRFFLISVHAPRKKCFDLNISNEEEKTIKSAHQSEKSIDQRQTVAVPLSLRWHSFLVLFNKREKRIRKAYKSQRKKFILSKRTNYDCGIFFSCLKAVMRYETESIKMHDALRTSWPANGMQYH